MVRTVRRRAAPASAHCPRASSAPVVSAVTQPTVPTLSPQPIFSVHLQHRLVRGLCVCVCFKYQKKKKNREYESRYSESQLKSESESLFVFNRQCASAITCDGTQKYCPQPSSAESTPFNGDNCTDSGLPAVCYNGL